MPTSKQRRAAERRRLRRQVQRRQERQARRKRINLIVSIVGTIAIIAVVVGVIIATNSDDDSTPAAGSGSPAPTTPTTPTTPSTPSSKPATTSAAPNTPSARPTTSAASPSKPPTSSPAASSSVSRGAGQGGQTGTTASCMYPTSGTAARKVNKPSGRAPATGTVRVAVRTSQGSLTFALDQAKAPCTVHSFVSLARQKYFDKTICHRLVTSGIYVLQCGDPTGTGRGGPGYKFNDELTGKEKYTTGVLAMANAGANTNGSQFFIVDKDSTLGPSYTIFGRVTSGLGVVQKVAAAGTTNGSTDGKPKLPVTIQQVTVG